MCSKDRKEVEDLKSKLFRAGIRSEISVNPVASALGVMRLEVHIHDADLIRASRIHQEFLATRDSDSASDGAENSSADSRAEIKEAELVIEPGRSRPARSKLKAPSLPSPPPANHQDNSSGDLAEAAALLEKEIEDVLARDHELAEQCSTLQEKVKTLDESLAQVRKELVSQSSDRSAAEQKLADANAAREALHKELESANARLKTAEKSLAEAHGQIESQTRELKLQHTKAGELSKEVASRDSQLSKLDESLAQARAELETEKGLRQAAEQKASDDAAVRKSLEQQVNHFAELESRFQDQQQHDREQIQYYFEAVNKMRGRLSQKRTSPRKA